jgi:hypothetical protein
MLHVTSGVLLVVPYRHAYVLLVAWGVTFLIALLALLLVGARATGWDLLGSVAGSALLGSMAGALAGVLASPDPDGFPGLAIPGATVGATTLGLVGLFFNSTRGRADPIARRVKAGLSGIPVVGVLVLLYFSAASEVVLGWTRYTSAGLCAALDPNDPFRQVAVCEPKFGPWALRLLAFDIALLALLFLLQAARAPTTRRTDPTIRVLDGG